MDYVNHGKELVVKTASGATTYMVEGIRGFAATAKAAAIGPEPADVQMYMM